MHISRQNRLFFLLSIIFFWNLGEGLATDGLLSKVTIDYCPGDFATISGYQISPNEVITARPCMDFNRGSFRINVYRDFAAGSNPWTFSVTSPSGSISQWTTPPGTINWFWSFDSSEEGTWTAQVDSGPTITWDIKYYFFVRFATIPTGCQYIVDGNTYTDANPPEARGWVPGSTHTISVISPQQRQGNRMVFANWSDGGALTHAFTVPQYGDVQLTARFDTQFPLTTTISPENGGTVSISPESPDGYYVNGTTVHLTATANPGYVFTGWSGDLTGSTNAVSLTVSAPKNIMASFAAYPLTTISTDPPGQIFTVDGSTYNAAQTFSWVPGSSHTISVASPYQSEETRYVFSNWSDGGAISHTIIAPSAATAYTAYFTCHYRLTIAVIPIFGGTVKANPTSSDGFYESGSAVQLTATPGAGYSFSSWSGDLTGVVNPQNITMSEARSVSARFSSTTGSVPLTLDSGGAAKHQTAGANQQVRSGFAQLDVTAGATPYATAVFSYRQNGVTVSEAGIPASPPTTQSRIFIDCRTGVNAIPGRSEAGRIDINTGIAIVNYGSAAADVTYTLRKTSGEVIAAGHGSIGAGQYFARFIDNLKDLAPDFTLPPDFQTTIQFGSLDISSSQPLSILALRGTMNQRDEFIMTTTPVADVKQPLNGDPIYFPQFVDGGGYTSSIILLNISDRTETGTMFILDKYGAPMEVTQVGGTANSTLHYSIPSGGAFRFQTDGSPNNIKSGWVRLVPDLYSSAPAGSGVLAYNPGTVMYSESGVPAATATTHARVFVDLSGNHNTGLAIANPESSPVNIEIRAFKTDGLTAAGTSLEPLLLQAYGNDAKFADQFIAGLPEGFTGVLDIRSTTPFAALTLRSLMNERHEFLMTAFPVADANRTAPSPIIFPQVADGGGYVTEFILISADKAASTILGFYDENGAASGFDK